MSKLFEDIKDSSNLITGHINPDGDALGSALAFKLILDSKGIDSDVSFDMKGNVPSNLNHLPIELIMDCLLYTSPSPRDATLSRMPSSA